MKLDLLRLLPFPLLLLALPLGACPGEGDDDDDDTPDPCEGVEAVSGTRIAFEEVTGDVERPTWVGSSPDGRMFVAEQGGRLRRVREDGSVTTYLDLRDRTEMDPGYDERGLLGVAFHPRFADNGKLYVDYITAGGVNGTSRISEFTVTGDPATDDPDPGSERVLLELPQPAFNHNGGDIHFGPDGYLYIAFGDGGGGGDTYGNGQRKGTWHAKILRIDVDNGDPYDIPADNPFVDDPDHMPETWAWGLRNPWRFSFDRQTGTMWIGDVGQNRLEEVDIGRAGANYGWPDAEGKDCTRNCDDYEAPIYDYGRGQGISVTGGVVYRGCAMPDLHGQYLLSDYGGEDLWSLVWATGADASVGDVDLQGHGFTIVGFGEDAQGEVYFADYRGSVQKIVPVR